MTLFDSNLDNSRIAFHSGKVTWQAPSNIALVKYWGKHSNQLPRNPSISFTLKKAYTEMIATYEWDKRRTCHELDFSFEGKANEKFEKKIAIFLQSIVPQMPFVSGLKLKIESHNSFPHSTGIASSASSMAALGLVLVSIENELLAQSQQESFSEKDFFRRASYYARLASGSACRSVYGGVVIWGQNSIISESSDIYAVPFDKPINPIYENYQDSILIVSSQEKSVSSRLGHRLMDNHPFADARYQQANRHLEELSSVLRSGDLEHFVNIIENEALTLHSLMMTSEPSYILLKANSLAIIEKVRDFRKTSNIQAAVTLDAGANIHLLYPQKDAQQVQDFIGSELLGHLENHYYITDSIGEMPKRF